MAGLTRCIVAGGWGMVILLAIEAGLQAKYLDSSNLGGVRGAVAIYFLIAFYFCCTLECVGYVYGCEIWPTHLRSKGSAVSYFGFYVFSIWSTAPAAQAFSSIGWKYYLVFICVTIALVIPCHFLPEVSPKMCAMTQSRADKSLDRRYIFGGARCQVRR